MVVYLLSFFFFSQYSKNGIVVNASRFFFSSLLFVSLFRPSEIYMHTHEYYTNYFLSMIRYSERDGRTNDGDRHYHYELYFCRCCCCCWNFAYVSSHWMYFKPLKSKWEIFLSPITHNQRSQTLSHASNIFVQHFGMSLSNVVRMEDGTDG